MAFCVMPPKAWGVFGGLFIISIASCGNLSAAQEPVLRVLVLEAKQLWSDHKKLVVAAGVDLVIAIIL